MTWNKIPVAIKQFILRIVIILITWKVLYLVFLMPTRILDKPLSQSVASNAAWILNIFTHSTDYTAKSENGSISTENGVVSMPLSNIYFHQRNIVSIEDGCNALELFILYAGFIVCMPGSMRKKLIFIVGGVLLIYIVNVIRCAGITYIILYDPKHADFAHHYVFTFIVYSVIIGLWLIFSKNLKIADAEV